jgi:hypothetical protein
MSLLLGISNMIVGLVLFFGMTNISSWEMFANPEAKIFPFILGVLLFCNGIYLTLRGEASWSQQR